MKSVLIFLAVLNVAACHITEKAEVAEWQQSLVTKNLSSPGALLKVNTVALQPVVLGPKLFEPDSLLDSIDRELAEILAGQLRVKIVPSQEYKKQNIATASDVEKKLSADAVLQTDLRRYIKRVGSTVGVTQAASVGFEMRLIRSRDGATIWKASYFNTDQSAAENILALKEKVKAGHFAQWVSERRMLSDGLNQALAKLASDRNSEFIK